MKKTSLLVAALFLLAGCGSHEVAARVGDTEISSAQVDRLTVIECASAGGGDQVAAARPVRQARARALGQLIDLEVLKAAGREHEEYDEAVYAQELTRLRQEFAALPDEAAAAAEDFYADYIKGILQLRDASLRGFAAEGVDQPDQEQLEQDLQARYAEVRERLDIEVNPAYGPDERGVPGSSDGSLSVAVSDYARQAGSPQPDPAHVGELAPKLLCG